MWRSCDHPTGGAEAAPPERPGTRPRGGRSVQAGRGGPTGARRPARGQEEQAGGARGGRSRGRGRAGPGACAATYQRSRRKRRSRRGPSQGGPAPAWKGVSRDLREPRASSAPRGCHPPADRPTPRGPAGHIQLRRGAGGWACVATTLRIWAPPSASPWIGDGRCPAPAPRVRAEAVCPRVDARRAVGRVGLAVLERVLLGPRVSRPRPGPPPPRVGSRGRAAGFGSAAAAGGGAGGPARRRASPGSDRSLVPTREGGPRRGGRVHVCRREGGAEGLGAAPRSEQRALKVGRPGSSERARHSRLGRRGRRPAFGPVLGGGGRSPAAIRGGGEATRGTSCACPSATRCPPRSAAVRGTRPRVHGDPPQVLDVRLRVLADEARGARVHRQAAVSQDQTHLPF